MEPQLEDSDIEPLDELERADTIAFELHSDASSQSLDLAVVFDLELVTGINKIDAVQRFLISCAERTTARYLLHGHYDDPLMTDAALWFSLQETFEGLSQMAPERLRRRFYFVTAKVAALYAWEFEKSAREHYACIGARAIEPETAFGRTIRFSTVFLSADPMRYPCAMRRNKLIELPRV